MANTKYTVAIGDEVCRLIAEGATILQAVQAVGLKNSQIVYGWAVRDEKFAAQLKAAKVTQIWPHADEILSIADNCAPDKSCVAKARLQIDARKWLLSKMIPKEYGEGILEALAAKLLDVSVPERMTREQWLASCEEPK